MVHCNLTTAVMPTLCFFKYKRDPDHSSRSSVKSHGGFMLLISYLEHFSFDLETQLHSEITLPTTEVEYSMLRTSLCTLLLIQDMLLEVTSCASAISITLSLQATIHSQAFQDKHSTMWQLAAQQCTLNHSSTFLSSGNVIGIIFITRKMMIATPSISSC